MAEMSQIQNFYIWSECMPTEEEIKAAVEAMQAVRVVGGKLHEDILRAYACAALEASQRTVMERVRKRSELRQIE